MPKTINRPVDKKETNELKKKAVIPDPVMKGYNEKNPAQPQGSFKPDSRTKGK
ncbi:MAG TPA: hypothetical protein VK498_01440 [Ferruginibacter sp.]|nr:hypothetical protein [Ferruginibacter sp.]